jgi:hypothetical protein
MSKPIIIKIEGVHGSTGTSMSSNDKDVIVDLSIKMVLSRELYSKYRTKVLDINDLNKLIENRI